MADEHVKEQRDLLVEGVAEDIYQQLASDKKLKSSLMKGDQSAVDSFAASLTKKWGLDQDYIEEAMSSVLKKNVKAKEFTEKNIKTVSTSEVKVQVEDKKEKSQEAPLQRAIENVEKTFVPKPPVEEKSQEKLQEPSAIQDQEKKRNNMFTNFLDRIKNMFIFMSERIVSEFKNLTGIVQGHLQEVFGPVFDLFSTGAGMLGSAISSGFNFISSLFSGRGFFGTIKDLLFGGEGSREEEQTQYLRRIDKNIMKRENIDDVKDAYQFKHWWGEKKHRKEQKKHYKAEEKRYKKTLKAMEKQRKVEEKASFRERLKDKGKGLLDLLLVPIFAAAGILAGLVSGYFKSIKLMFRPFVSVSKGLFGKEGIIVKSLIGIKTFFTDIGTKIGNVTKLFPIARGVFTKLFSVFSKIGGFIIPLEMIWKTIKGLFSEGTIRDKILNASAGILSVLTKIPEIIINSVMSLFGSDFRVDFSAEKIVAAVNKITNLLNEYLVDPLFNFINITIPNTIESIKQWFSDMTPDWLKNIWEGVKQKFMKLGETIGNIFEPIITFFKEKFEGFVSLLKKIPVIGKWFEEKEKEESKQKSLAEVVRNPNVTRTKEGLKVGKSDAFKRTINENRRKAGLEPLYNIPTDDSAVRGIRDTERNAARKQREEKQKTQKQQEDILKTQKEVNNNISEMKEKDNTVIVQPPAQNQRQVDDPPEEPENASLWLQSHVGL